MPTTSYSFAPNSFIPENEKYRKGGEWFWAMSRYIASMYNRQVNKYPGNVSPTSSPNSALGILSWENPVLAMLNYYMYYEGRQQNLQYAFASTDTNNNPLGTPFIPGRKTAQLIDHMVGVGNTLLKSSRVSTKSASAAAQNRRSLLIEKTQLFYDLKEAFEDLAQSTGIQYSPLGGQEQNMELNEQFYQWVEFDYKERMEKIAYSLVEDSKARNHFVEYCTNLLKHALIGGVVATRPYSCNNKVYWRFYEGYSVIWDNHKDNEQNRDARYVGLLEYLTPAEIISEMGDKMSEELKEKVMKLETSNFNTPSASSVPIYPLVLTNSFGVQVAVVRTYWRGMKDSRYRVTFDDKGIEHIVKLNSKEEKRENGDYWWETWYKATMIADLGIADYGECYNNVAMIEDRARLEPPVKVWIPGVTLGSSNSIASRLYQHQDRKDWLMNEITRKINNSPGRVGVFRGSKLGTKDLASLMDDFKRYQMTVVNLDASGDPNDPLDNQRLVEEMNFTMDEDLPKIIELMRVEDTLMEEIASVSKIALGQQQQYVGLNTQQATIAQNSLGNEPLYYSFMKHISAILQHDVNMQKNIIANMDEDEIDEGIPLVGKRDIEFLKDTKDLMLEDFGVYIKADDIIDEAARNRLLAYAQAWSQNPESTGVAPVDLVKMETIKTYTELINYFDYVFKRNERMKEKAFQQQQIMQAIEQERSLQNARVLEQERQGGANYREELKVSGDLSKESMKQENTPQQTPKII